MTTCIGINKSTQLSVKTPLIILETLAVLFMLIRIALQIVFAIPIATIAMTGKAQTRNSSGHYFHHYTCNPHIFTLTAIMLFSETTIWYVHKRLPLPETTMKERIRDSYSRILNVSATVDWSCSIVFSMCTITVWVHGEFLRLLDDEMKI